MIRQSTHKSIMHDKLKIEKIVDGLDKDMQVLFNHKKMINYQQNNKLNYNEFSLTALAQ